MRSYHVKVKWFQDTLLEGKIYRGLNQGKVGEECELPDTPRGSMPRAVAGGYWCLSESATWM